MGAVVKPRRPFKLASQTLTRERAMTRLRNDLEFRRSCEMDRQLNHACHETDAVFILEKINWKHCPR